MTREEKLISMKMMDLAEVAQKLNIKIDVKGSKSKAVAKILAAESAIAESKPVEVPAVQNDDVCGDGTPLAEVGKQIAEQAKKKAERAKAVKSEKKPTISGDEVLNAVSTANIDCVVRRGGKDIRLSVSGKCVGLLYVGARNFTAYFNSESVKTLLENAGYEILTSKEKFNYYSKIDSAILSEVLVNIVND